MSLNPIKRSPLSCLAGLALTLTACVDTGQIGSPSPLPFPLDQNSGQVTMDAETFIAVAEARFRSGERPLCGIGVPSGGLGFSAFDYVWRDDAPGVGEVWVGYSNGARPSQSRRGINDRCEDRHGVTYHAVVNFDETLFHRIVDQTSERRGETVIPRVTSATLRVERRSAPVDRSEGCVIGRRSPLTAAIFSPAPITIIDGPPGATTVGRVITIPAPESRPDLEIVRYGHEAYAGNGREFTMGIADYHLQTPQVALFDEEEEAGRTTLFISANEEGLQAINNAFLLRDDFQLGASLFSLTNTAFGTSRDCMAVYGDIRLNLQFELEPSGSR
ncbi:MAG: hypothetical protein AAGC83_04260 [Pseudomonadota bacterium]